jgi:hypothetical protein
MLNPSTADAEVDDPTVRRCMTFAKSWGFAGIEVVNLFALRATDPRIMKAHQHPISSPTDNEKNDKTILASASGAGLVVCAWGVHGAFRARGARILGALNEASEEPHYLALTKDRQPRHPLYLRGGLQPTPFSSSRRH